MQIREANIKHSDGIKKLHLEAFKNSEAELLSDLAINLLHEKSPIKTISPSQKFCKYSLIILQELTKGCKSG